MEINRNNCELKDEVLEEFLQSLEWKSFANLGVDVMQASIKTIVENEILKELPIVKISISVLKFGKNMRERNLLKQQLNFIKTLNDGTIPNDELKKHQTSLEQDPKKLEKELGRVMLLLDRHTEYMQSQVLARFYQAYIKREVSWAKFCELAAANERIFISDYEILLAIFNKLGRDTQHSDYTNNYQVDRLISLGFLSKKIEVSDSDISESLRWGGSAISGSRIITITLTPFGELICKFLPKRAN